MTTTKRAYKLRILFFFLFLFSFNIISHILLVACLDPILVEEFVAHASSVNCLKIGRKSSRVLVTGGEDHKVNLWAIGKPNAIVSLSGHSSGIDSVSFDSSEVLVAAGAASGTVKLWDLEEAKIVRTLTGHRSNCISLDFHPFGEFFASGSLDTNLKIWDIRRKGCIHTYKGHTRGVNAIRFTPDGRWVVSGGEDNTVKFHLPEEFNTRYAAGEHEKYSKEIKLSVRSAIKLYSLKSEKTLHGKYNYVVKSVPNLPADAGVSTGFENRLNLWSIQSGLEHLLIAHNNLWDLTAGKLLHEFKCHEGQIQCIDFHPHEFLLATGSADRTVKFWDLETFELIGSAGPETTGVRCMTFNPDGRTLLCGLHESLKVFSWEPIRCHDAVDVGWSRLSDLNIHEGKLLGCSYNQSCVGVWVVDISRIEPYAAGNSTRSNGMPEPKANTRPVLTENTAKAGLGRLSTSQNSDPIVKEIKSLERLSVSQNSDPINKELKSITSTGTVPGTPQRVNLSAGLRTAPITSVAVPTAAAPKRNASKILPAANISIFSRSDVVPVVVPRNTPRLEQAAEARKEGVTGRIMPLSLHSKTPDLRKFSNIRDDLERPVASEQPEPEVSKATELSGVGNNFSALKSSAGFPAVERNVKDDKCSVSGKHLMTESLASYQHGSCPNFLAVENRVHRANRDACAVEGQKGGRTRTLVASWEKKDRFPYHEGVASNNLSGAVSAVNMLATNAVWLFLL
ncbi:hypothetical protein RJ639_018305 [Escallonia herrerae]|uniref:Katanin p80 WD40 repeat-containing subunit B1 homolog n=1 Tax=Escallonia herrerae TaxID=1293975 RepID=A0AA89AJN1_9ASTE|nr:hypothetical protein RJ639_018305 [Escallonia herrerae]